MGVFSDFSSWVSKEADAIGGAMSSTATGFVNTAKYGLKTVVHVPVAITHEISSGVVQVSQAGVGAFKAGAYEASQAFGSGATAFVAASHEGALAVGSLGKSASGAVGSLGSSFALPLAAAAAGGSPRAPSGVCALARRRRSALPEVLLFSRTQRFIGNSVF